jgi:hypothetical protein
MICTLGTEFAHFFLLEQDGETATSTEIIGFPGRAAQP